jgi:acetolactate synthase-1/2/3 large subunit
MGFGAPAAIGAKLACPDKVVVALVGDGGFGQNPAMLATAVESNVPVVWVIMNNYAYGTIAGLQLAHFGTTFGCVFSKDDKPYSPPTCDDRSALTVREGVQIKSRRVQALRARRKSNRPVVIDVAMQNEPVPTGGHWNINDIYSPGREVSHLAVEVTID